MNVGMFSAELEKAKSSYIRRYSNVLKNIRIGMIIPWSGYSSDKFRMASMGQSLWEVVS
jgi:hypothetical protein